MSFDPCDRCGFRPRAVSATLCIECRAVVFGIPVEESRRLDEEAFARLHNRPENTQEKG